jgi:EspA/EspE family
MASGSQICQNTLNLIKGLLFALGEPSIPELGQSLLTGSGLFKNIETKLDGAFPGLDWVGEAADKYSAQNLAQQLRMDTMSDMDKLTNGFVSNQAGYIQDARDTLHNIRGHCERLQSWCEWWENIPIIGDAISWASSAPTNLVFGIIIGNAMLQLTLKTLNNAMNLTQLIPNLISLITSLPKDILDWIKGLLPPIKLPDLKWPPDFNLPDWIKFPEIKLPDIKWPDIPGFPGFPDIKFPDFKLPDFKFPGLDGLPKLPDLFPGLPKLTDLFGGLIPRLPSWTELANLPEFLGGILGLPGMNFADMLGLASMPTFNQLTATISQLTQLAGGGGGMNMLSQVGSQAGSLSSLASAGGAGGAGGAQSATLVSDVKQDDDEGAGAGTPGGERAPVQDTGGTTGQTQPGRVL